MAYNFLIEQAIPVQIFHGDNHVRCMKRIDRGFYVDAVVNVGGDDESDPEDSHVTTRKIWSSTIPEHFEVYRVPRTQLGVHHTKNIIVFMKNRIRVVTMTSNLTQAESVDGIWTQVFPLKSSQAFLPACDMEETLCDYFSQLDSHMASSKVEVVEGEPKRPVRLFELFLYRHVHHREALRRYDFSDASITLVTSIPGIHSGESLLRYGHLKVRQTLLRAAPHLNRWVP